MNEKRKGAKIGAKFVNRIGTALIVGTMGGFAVGSGNPLLIKAVKYVVTGFAGMAMTDAICDKTDSYAEGYVDLIGDAIDGVKKVADLKKEMDE